jgi:hypothetical protein
MSILGQKFSCPHISDDFRLGADWQQRRESERRIVTLEDDWVYWNCPAPPDGEAWSLPFCVDIDLPKPPSTDSSRSAPRSHLTTGYSSSRNASTTRRRLDPVRLWTR